MHADLDRSFPGVDWDFSQIIRDNVMEALSGVKGENAIKIFGPDLNKLEEMVSIGSAADAQGLHLRLARHRRCCRGHRYGSRRPRPMATRGRVDAA
jgi:hypothetical protein